MTRRGGGARWAAMMLLPSIALASCTIERRAGADSSISGEGEAVQAPAPAGAAPASAAATADTPVAAPPAPIVTPAPAPGDTLPLAASAAELEALAAALIVPVQGVRREDLRDTFNEARGERVHEALDILAPRNTPVLAATDGRVLELHESVAGGLMVYAADAADRFVMMYGHLESYAPGLAKGQALRQGQVIGYVGTSGNAPANTPHLHFVISRGRPSVSWWRGTPVNPYPLLTGAGAH